MKFQSILLVAALAATSYASTIADVENDIANITSQVTALDTVITNFPATGGSLVVALSIHTSAVNVDSAIDKGTADVNGAPKPVSEADATTILNAAQALEPTILDALVQIVKKKPAFDGLPIGGIGALVKQDLINLNASTTLFEIALINSSPADLKSQATAIKTALDAAFSTAIAAYANP